jgi:hypothetical protein
MHEWDRPVEQQWVYAAIGQWRGWEKAMTLEPYYLALSQSAYPGTTERLVHSPGLRVYGKISVTGFDYDLTYTNQFGRNGAREVRAWAATAEIGYTLTHPWKPRVSLFYGHATGDRDPNDNTDNRFERFFGFGRPWSANDYIVYENIRAPKLRIELTPKKNLRVDFGYSWTAPRIALQERAKSEIAQDPVEAALAMSLIFVLVGKLTQSSKRSSDMLAFFLAALSKDRFEAVTRTSRIWKLQ